MHWTPLEICISDPSSPTVLETVVTLIVIAVTIYLTRRRVADIVGWRKIAKSWWLLPLAFGLAVPLFYYHLSLPPYIYAVWITVSVFWQQYLTFGLPQPYLTKLIGAKRGSVPTVAMFYLGHAIILLDQFLPTSTSGAMMTGWTAKV